MAVVVRDNVSAPVDADVLAALPQVAGSHGRPVEALLRSLSSVMAEVQGYAIPAALEAAIFRPQTGYYRDLVAEAPALLKSLAIHPPVPG